MAAKKAAEKKAAVKSAKKEKVNSKGAGRKSPAPDMIDKPKNYRVRSIILMGIGFVSVFLFLVHGGALWGFIRDVLYGLFGTPAILLPVLFFYLGFMNAKEKEIHRLKAKVIMCITIITLSAMEFYIFTGEKQGFYLSELGREFASMYKPDSLLKGGGGLLGTIIGYPLSYWFGNVISFLLVTVALVVILLIITGVSVMDIKKRVDDAKNRVANRRTERARIREEENLTADFPPHYNERIDIPIDDGKKKKHFRKNKDNPEVKNNNSDNVVNIPIGNNKSLAEERNETDDLIEIIKRANQSFDDNQSDAENSASEAIAKDKTDAFVKAAQQVNQNVVVDDKLDDLTKFDNEIMQNEQDTDNNYQLPPVQLLKLAHNKNQADASREMHEKAEKLVSTLDSFGVKVSISNICRGPSVTRYELQPAPGVKISKITNLADDIALNLAANGVRIEAPIPGKAAVGIEVPNKSVSMVSMRELIDSNEFRSEKSKLTCVLGRDISGEIVTTDLAKMPHLLIAGTTGSGKSVCVNSLLMSILYRATPNEVKFLLIDPKMVEFSKYKGIPHLLVPVVSDPKKAAAALNWAVSEMESRYKILSEYDCKDINSYNDLVESNLQFIAEQNLPEGEEPEVLEVNGLPVAKEKMFSCVIAIDELADLMMTSGNEVEESICRLAQKARAAGMHLVIATQRPSVNVITGVIKANIPSRISLKVSSNIDSRTILDFGGAEKLIGRGDMLYSPVGAPKPVRVQGCFASDAEIEGVTNYIKKHHRSQYNEEVEARIKKITVEGAENEASASAGNENLDEKIEEAIKVVLDAGQASTSLVQRRLKVGYARAGRMIDEMEDLGVIGPHQGSKPREVLMTYQEWLERKNINADNSGEV